jgi:hypothetical protein
MAPRSPNKPFDERKHAGRRGGAVLEETAGTPTRKSTRKSSDRTKRTTNLQLREIRKTSSPGMRHARNSARGGRGR